MTGPRIAWIRRRLSCSLALAAVALMGACGERQTAAPQPQASSAPPAVVAAPALSLPAQVGARMFTDVSLSGSGRMSCATCHDPNSAHGPPNDLSVQLGGHDMTMSGTRAVPSLRYKDMTPPYADLLDNPDGISVPGPGGGFAWDGRLATLADQSHSPLLGANEMANENPAAVVAKLKASSYAELFRQAFGKEAFDDVDAALRHAGQALQAYQLEDPVFRPYSSKFDLYAGNKIGGDLTPAEARGLRVFADPKTGNCASCHYQGAGLNGSSALFTDFSYQAIGVPRNMKIPANADPKYFDIGICGPLRTDHPPVAGNTFCGMFKAPTLRNVAERKSFFHNGVMHSLEQVIHFYNTRDTRPELWYPTVGGKPKASPDPDFPTYGLITTQYVGGKVRKFDDLPPQFLPNIDTQMPMDGRKAGSAAPMTEGEMADLICFLKTLSDGYKPSATPPASGPCVE